MSDALYTAIALHAMMFTVPFGMGAGLFIAVVNWNTYHQSSLETTWQTVVAMLIGGGCGFLASVGWPVLVVIVLMFIVVFPAVVAHKKWSS